MERPKGSKNKEKCCTTLSHCLQDAVATQDADHLESQNHNVLSVINGDESETESEYESDFDDSVFDKNFEPERLEEQGLASFTQEETITMKSLCL